MNSISVNLHNYCSKLVNLHNLTQINVLFQVKLCKFYSFFYYKWTDVNTLSILDFFVDKVHVVLC